MAKTTELEEAEARLVEDSAPGGLRKAASRLFDLLKAKAPVPPPDDDDDDADDDEDDDAPDVHDDDDDDDDDDGPPPSAEDAVKDAAPDKPAPPPMPAGAGADDGPAPAGADDGAGADPDDADGEEDGGAPGGAAVAGGDDDGDDEEDEGDDADGDDDGGAPADAKLRKQVLRRSAENPDFFKSLLEGDEAAEVVRMIDASDVLAFIVQTFSEQLAAAYGETAQLRKSLGRRLTDLEQGQTVTLLALEKSLAGQATLQKALGRQATLLKSLGDAPLPTPSGLRQLRPQRRAAEPELADPTLGADSRQYDKGRISQTLMKGQMAGTLNMGRAGDLMLLLDTADGPGRVAKYLEQHHPELYQQAVG